MVKSNDLPYKVNDYYEVHVYSENLGATSGEGDSRRIFYLVPPNAVGPDGQTVDEQRVFELGAEGQLLPLSYQKEIWWEEYR